MKDNRRRTRRKFSAEKKIRIVLEGLRGQYLIAELCRHEGFSQGLCYSWSKEFMEASKKRLSSIGCKGSAPHPSKTSHSCPAKRHLVLGSGLKAELEGHKRSSNHQQTSRRRVALTSDWLLRQTLPGDFEE